MAKRFTDSDKWKKSWFRTLRPVHKCLWEYIRDNCDHAGIWEVDFGLASMMIGEEIHPIDAMEAFRKQYLPFALGKRWLIVDFIDFQYGELNPKNNAHRSVISLLSKAGIYDAFLNQKRAEMDMKTRGWAGGGQGVASCPAGALDQDMDQDMDQDSSKDQIKEEDKDQDPANLQNLKSRLKVVAATEILSSEQPRRKGRAKTARTVCPEDFEISDSIREYCEKKNHPAPEQFRDSFVNYWRGRGELMADWSATFRNYMDGPFRPDKMESRYGQNGSGRGNPGGFESAQAKRDRRIREVLGKYGSDGNPTEADNGALSLLSEGDPSGRYPGRGGSFGEP